MQNHVCREIIRLILSKINRKPPLSSSVLIITAQRRISRAREEANKMFMMDLKVDNQDDGKEYHFWEGRYIYIFLIFIGISRRQNY